MFFVAVAFVGAVLAGLFASDVLTEREGADGDHPSQDAALSNLAPTPSGGAAPALLPAAVAASRAPHGRQVVVEYPRPPHFGKPGPRPEQEPWRPSWPAWLTLHLGGGRTGEGRPGGPDHRKGE